MRGRFVFRGQAIARSLPVPRFHQGVGVEAPMRHLFVAIAVRGCIQEVRLGDQKPVDECINGFNGQDRHIDGGVQANTVVIVMMQGPILKDVNIAAVCNLLMLGLAPIQAGHILKFSVSNGFAPATYIVADCWIFHRTVEQGKVQFRGQVVRQLPCPSSDELFVFIAGCLQCQAVRNRRLGAEEVGIDPAIVAMHIGVRREFAAKDQRCPRDAILDPREGHFPASP